MADLRYKRQKAYLSILKRYILKSCFRKFGFFRSEDFIKAQYSELEKNNSVSRTRATRELNGHLVQWRIIDGAKFRVSYARRVLAQLNFETYGGIKAVLDLGSGSGFITLALAACFPAIKIWRGIDLTPARITVANSLLADPPLQDLRHATGLDEKIIKKRLAGSDIKFQEGNILNLPYPDESFDVVFSAQVIEQLPRDYRRAFEEVRRVTANYAFFIEEFLEVQNFFHRLHLHNVDYFCASFKEVEKAGFRVLIFEPYPLNPVYYRLGFVLCSK